MVKEISLFTTKDLYVMEHTENGRSRRFDHIPKCQRRKKIHENMHLMEGMTFTSNPGYPQMSPYTGTTDFISVSYDLSLWRDLPTDFYNRENVFRTRFVGAYWQICGYSVIPTASWGNLSSFS